jgi:hypothetical protein
MKEEHFNLETLKSKDSYVFNNLEENSNYTIKVVLYEDFGVVDMENSLKVTFTTQNCKLPGKRRPVYYSKIILHAYATCWTHVSSRLHIDIWTFYCFLVQKRINVSKVVRKGYVFVWKLRELAANKIMENSLLLAQLRLALGIIAK